MQRVLILLALALLFPSGTRAGNVPLGQAFVLGVGEFVEVGDLPILVRFDGILADSRCPSEVLCFWEGEATAELTLSTPSGETIAVQLHTRSSPFGPSHVSFVEHVVSLRQVSPYPEGAEPIDPSSYRVELVVQPQATVPLDVSSWSALKGRFR